MNPLQAEATSKGSDEYFEDMQRLLEARQSMSSSNFGVSVGISFVNVGVKGNAESEFLNNLTKYQSQVYSKKTINEKTMLTASISIIFF